MRVLVADDSVLFRRLLADLLASLPGVEVAATAANGRIALQKVRELKPDLLTLDIEMPDMDGLAVLDALRQRGGPMVETIVVSAQSRRGGDLTIRALEKGAFDFIAKPDAGNPAAAREGLLRELGPRIRAARHRMEVHAILKGRSAAATQPDVPGPSPQPVRRDSGLEGIATRMQRLSHPGKPELVLIGVSTGGPVALGQLLPAIPADIGVPILIVQHMPPIFTKSLAESLALKCAVDVREAVDGEAPRPGTVYIAPGGRQMRLGGASESGPVIELTDDPPENNCRPAVDYLFRSVASRFPGRAMAVILTGMGSDGTLGLRLLKRHGCFVIAQDEESSVVYGMPKAAAEAGMADVILPLHSIAARLASVVRGGPA